MRWLDGHLYVHRVRARSRSWWWTGKPGVLQSMGSQRVGHNWATDIKTNIKIAYPPSQNWELAQGPSTFYPRTSQPSSLGELCFQRASSTPNCPRATFTQCLSPRTQQFQNIHSSTSSKLVPPYSASLAWKERQHPVETLRLKRFWELASPSFSSLSPIDFFPLPIPSEIQSLPLLSIPNLPAHP